MHAVARAARYFSSGDGRTNRVGQSYPGSVHDFNGWKMDAAWVGGDVPIVRVVVQIVTALAVVDN